MLVIAFFRASLVEARVPSTSEATGSCDAVSKNRRPSSLTFNAFLIAVNTSESLMSGLIMRRLSRMNSVEDCFVST